MDSANGFGARHPDETSSIILSVWLAYFGRFVIKIVCCIAKGE